TGMAAALKALSNAFVTSWPEMFRRVITSLNGYASFVRDVGMSGSEGTQRRVRRSPIRIRSRLLSDSERNSNHEVSYDYQPAFPPHCSCAFDHSFTGG